MAEPAEIGPLPEADLPPERWDARLLTRAGLALDATMLRGMQAVVDTLLMPTPENLPWLRASADSVLDPALQAEPARFFAFGAEPLEPTRVTNRVRRPLEDGVAVSRRLEILYRPYGLEAGLEAAPAAGPEGSPAATGRVRERILLEHWMHQDSRARGTIVLLHGYTMGRPRLDAPALFATHWYRRGLDVVLLTLPHHGRRTPPGARFSGQAFAVPHVARLSEAVRQAIYEIRLVVDWLQARSDAPVGLLGLSLGGYLAALAAGLYDDLDFVVPMVPPVCIGDLAWRFFTRSRHHRGGLPAAFSADELRRLYRIHSPLAHPLRLPRERALIVAGRGDRIVPPEHPHALWQHWGQPDIHWFSGSHLAPFGRQRIVDAIVGHLRRNGVL